MKNAPLDRLDDIVERLAGGRGANVGLGSRAEALGERAAELHATLAQRLKATSARTKKGKAYSYLRDGLRIRVGDHKLDALEAARNHVVDGIATGASHTHNRDARARKEVRVQRRRRGRRRHRRLWLLSSPIPNG